MEENPPAPGAPLHTRLPDPKPEWLPRSRIRIYGPRNSHNPELGKPIQLVEAEVLIIQ